MQPGAYVELHKRGELRARAEQALARLAACDLCPHRCLVDRTAGELGYCRTGRNAIVASAGPHFGEERPLVGRGGSGTIFFAACNLACVYCQNADISQLDRGEVIKAEALAELMLELERRGCENLNFVSPSHVVTQILEALVLAAERGLSLPLVYNTGGYDTVDTLRLLDGVVDIYMPDVKYGNGAAAARLSAVPDYPQVNRAALLEMHRQVGNLVIEGDGLASRGLLVRHLVLPHDLAATAEVMRFIAEEVSPDTYVNVMAQYHPCHEAGRHPELGRRPTREELGAAVQAAKAVGLWRLD